MKFIEIGQKTINLNSIDFIEMIYDEEAVEVQHNDDGDPILVKKDSNVKPFQIIIEFNSSRMKLTYDTQKACHINYEKLQDLLDVIK